MVSEKYALTTGEDAEYRLKIVNSVHGADSEAFLKLAGLAEGMRVADIGCGVGVMSLWIAEQVGESGHVAGVDISVEQVVSAEKAAVSRGVHNLEFNANSCYDTGLVTNSFDLVYSRFMLMHIQDPLRAINEMKRLLKPGGVLAIEDGDFASTYAEPHSPAYDRMFELYRQIGEKFGEDFLIGRKLFRMAITVGFERVSARLAQPVFTEGDSKRLPEWTLEESAPALLEAGLTTKAELERLLNALRMEANDPTTLFSMARMTQVIGFKKRDSLSIGICG